jgi:thiamine biosynthesis lipoprotein
MSKIPTDLVRHTLNGPTMGTRWSALFYATSSFDPEPVRLTLQAAVDEVDNQMSTWKPASDLMRLNAAAVGEWQTVPSQLLEVLQLGLEVGKVTGGAFDIGMGDAVTGWGFGPEAAVAERIQAAMSSPRTAASDALELDHASGRVRKTASIVLDLNAIAKGYGVDRLADKLAAFGVSSGLVSIDGELRALGLQSNGLPWTIAVEAPNPERRTPHAVMSLQDAAVATSGDYRHWVEVQGRRFSHTMDPQRGAPILSSPASVTVVAKTCAQADAWATALMVLGSEVGAKLAERHELDALFLIRNDDGNIRDLSVGRLFANEPSANDSSLLSDDTKLTDTGITQ